MIRYYRTNIQHPEGLQKIYMLDNDRIINLTNGIAEYIPLAHGEYKHGVKLVEIDGDSYDKAIQAYLKATR